MEAYSLVTNFWLFMNQRPASLPHHRHLRACTCQADPHLSMIHFSLACLSQLSMLPPLYRHSFFNSFCPCRASPPIHILFTIWAHTHTRLFLFLFFLCGVVIRHSESPPLIVKISLVTVYPLPFGFCLFNAHCFSLNHFSVYQTESGHCSLFHS